MKFMKLGIAAAAMLTLGAFAAPGTAEAAPGVAIRAPGVSLYVDSGRRHYRHRNYRGRNYYRGRSYRGRGYGYHRSRCGGASNTCAYKWGYGGRQYYRCMRNYNCR